MNSIFINLLNKYNDNNFEKSYKAWEVLHENYTKSGRHYHNLSHLFHLLKLFNDVYLYIINKDLILFAIFYHDVIQLPTGMYNEINSAQYFKSDVKYFMPYLPEDLKDKVVELILSTETHEYTNKNDFDLFLDMDMAILGVDNEYYNIYKKTVKLEYIPYFSEKEYNENRLRFLNKILNSDIYYTNYFLGRYKVNAIENIMREINEIENDNKNNIS